MAEKTEKVDFNEFQISWELFSLTLWHGFAADGLERLWNSSLGQGQYDFWNFFDTFNSYSEVLHLVSALELRPIADPKKKVFLKKCIADAMADKARHDAIYNEGSKPFKDQMVAWLKEACEQQIHYWENIEETIGKSLNVKDDPWTGEDHPLDDLLTARERIGWVLLGIRNQQAEDKYVTVDLPAYTRRMKIADLTLEKLVIISVTYHYPEYRSTIPYAPPDFWWRHLKGHECLTPEENWAEKWLDYDKAFREVKKIEEEQNNPSK